MIKYILTTALIAFIFLGCGNKKNVVTKKSGLEYLDTKSGSGTEAKAGNRVTLDVEGWFVKNKDDYFTDWSKDSTKMRNLIIDTKRSGRPVRYVLGSGEFIHGIDSGIVGMKVGGERTIIIPSKLAYGKRGYGPIPPNSDLKIMVELHDVAQITQPTMWKADSTKIKTTSDGLKYVIIEPGTGPNAKPGDLITVNYNGWLTNGKLFDSSFRRGEPFKFTLGKGMVIKGWDEGLQHFNKGAKGKLILPPGLAYGDRDMGVIPPHSTLIFDIQVVDIQEPSSN